MTHYCLVCRRDFYLPGGGRAECGQCDLPLIQTSEAVPVAVRVRELDAALLLIVRRHSADVLAVKGRSPREVLRGMEDAGGVGENGRDVGRAIVQLARDVFSTLRGPFARLGARSWLDTERGRLGAMQRVNGEMEGAGK